jgi:hypothetical protein
MWLLGENERREVTAALDFIKTNGSRVELAVLEKILPNMAERDKNDVSMTIITLASKDGALSGLTKLMEANLDSVPGELLDAIFGTARFSSHGNA